MKSAGIAGRDQRRDLLLFVRLPVDEGLDVRMIDVEADHLGGAPGGAAALDRAGRAIADPQEAHQAGGGAAAGKRFALAAQVREIGAGAGAIFEEARLADPEVHDAAFADQIVID